MILKVRFSRETELCTHCSMALTAMCTSQCFTILESRSRSRQVREFRVSRSMKSRDYDDSIINGSKTSHYVGGWAASECLEIDEGSRPAKITRTPSHKNRLSPSHLSSVSFRPWLFHQEAFRPLRSWPGNVSLNVSKVTQEGRNRSDARPSEPKGRPTFVLDDVSMYFETNCRRVDFG